MILGGGPAGAAAAITLARAGARPLVLERQRETGDAICGGFLSWRSLAALGRLGVEVAGAEAREVRLFSGTRSTRAPLPEPALGVSRRQLDSAMLRQAEAAGAMVERGVHVREADGRHIRADNEAFWAERLLLATGKHDLRGLARPKLAADPAVGLRVRLGPATALSKLIEGAIELHLFDRGYAGLVLQEDGTGNLCLAVRKSRLNEAGGPAALLQEIGREVPALGERLAWLAADAPIDAIAAVPYGWRTAETSGGIYRLGDQAGVIPSLAGEGMGIALASGVMAGEGAIRGETAQAFQRRLAGRTRRPIAIASAVLAAAERPGSAAALVKLMRLAPGLASLLARVTRVSH
ncbi:NAD(P)/FAD-dependent oxidoreductase [Sphingomonas sp.]|uniref:NAD(P)/FAD-dependent oxidoreductase n=1 Tax=Sphingomonas sp. TaxID=28214 RepID=UPI002DF14D4D|nr:FAD-dependent monooxygenase [Sphingomonas sp.]HEV2569901.1 FAD-dependent monooxygenase [Sphingomonas sp.]